MLRKYNKYNKYNIGSMCVCYILGSYRSIDPRSIYTHIKGVLYLLHLLYLGGA